MIRTNTIARAALIVAAVAALLLVISLAAHAQPAPPVLGDPPTPEHNPCVPYQHCTFLPEIAND